MLEELIKKEVGYCRLVMPKHHLKSEEEADYLENEWPKVEASLKEWEQEFPEEERIEPRLEYLADELKTVTEEYLKESKDWIERPDKQWGHWQFEYIQKLKRRMAHITVDIRRHNHKDARTTGITDEQIARAREYPITSLVESRHGMAKCLFHKEKTASMSLKHNRYYCFGCGEKGDTIDLLVKTKGMTFQDAVRSLAP